jgi:hypothetical protein
MPYALWLCGFLALVIYALGCGLIIDWIAAHWPYALLGAIACGFGGIVKTAAALALRRRL